MIILIDNYDSFTYNLVQYLAAMGADVHVIRNDACTAADIFAQKPNGIVISPGPSDPDHAGICLDVIKHVLNGPHIIPLLGVCLGHQALGQAAGGRVVRAPAPMHGKISEITHNNTSVFAELPNPIVVARYHSLIVERATLPPCFSVTAETSDGLIMAMQHTSRPLHGVQFHPESIATAHGHAMLKHFLALTHAIA